MTQKEALDMITKLQLAQQAMKAACKRIDELKAENKALKKALAQPEQFDLNEDLKAWQKDGSPIPAKPEQEPIEDLQAKLKWATEQLEANINWEFVAAAKEEMLKAAWAEIKELREQIKELDQEPVAKAVVNKRNTDENQITNIDLTLTEAGKRLPSGEHRLYTTPLQHSAIARKPLTDEWIEKFLAFEGNPDEAYQHGFRDGVAEAEAAHGIKG